MLKLTKLFLSFASASSALQRQKQKFQISANLRKPNEEDEKYQRKQQQPLASTNIFGISTKSWRLSIAKLKFSFSFSYVLFVADEINDSKFKFAIQSLCKHLQVSTTPMAMLTLVNLSFGLPRLVVVVV